MKTIYPSPTQENAWSPPVFWTYKVSDDGGSRVVLSVLNSQGEEHLKLTYSRNNHALLRAEILKQRRSEGSVISLNFQTSAPVLSSQSAIPFDTPVFPLRPGTSTEFLVQRRVGDQLNAIETLRQTVHETNINPPEISNGSPGGTLDVVCTRADGTLLFRQFWSPEHPWPLYGENSNMKYWLVLP